MLHTLYILIFGGLSAMIGGIGGTSANYVAEDGTTFYVAEDNATFYINEF
jgi:hypothetical protein